MQMLTGRSREEGEDYFARLQSRAENDLEKLMAVSEGVSDVVREEGGM